MLTPTVPRRPAVWPLALALAALLAAALAWDNSQYLFRTELHEFDDLAVNALQIDRAKTFHELYGQYSRWGFHHPGPAFFYVQAWGELVFHDWLGLVPAPLNAQMLATLLLNAGFLGTALATAARRVGGRTIFLPLVLALGVFHVAAIQFQNIPLGALLLIGNWPGFFLVAPFVCLLVAAAAVASGRGESLPLAALAGGFLAHGHVAQGALFVLPLCALAYAGLLFTCPDEPPAGDPPEKRRTRWAWLGRPARRFPRAHVAAALIVAVFALPLLIDLCRGADSNLARILAFRREHAHEPHKKLVRSLMYFLQYALYQWYSPQQDFFGDYTAAGAWAFLKANRFVGELWLGALLGSLAVAGSWLRRFKNADDDTRARWRFAGALWVMVGAAVGSTLAWGCVMNGQMVYYNAFLNFGLCYVGMLAAAAMAADVWRAPAWRWEPYAGAALLGVLNADHFRLVDYACDARTRQIVETTAAALRAEGPPPRTRYLEFGGDWTLAVNVALQLQRAGQPYSAPAGWGIVFGFDHCPADPLEGLSRDGRLFTVWKILPPDAAPPGGASWPLTPDRLLVTTSGSGQIRPDADDTIRFDNSRGDANFASYTLLGWNGPEGPAAPFVWSLGKEAALGFRAAPVPAESAVRVVFDAFPLLLAGRLDAQRLGVVFNGQDLGTATRTGDGPFEVVIPAAVWNGRPDALLVLRTPDADSPAHLGAGGDGRVLGFGFRRIEFRAVPAAAATLRR